MLLLSAFVVTALSFSAHGANIVLTNDDGWATAMIRAQNNALKAAGHNVVLSAPANDESGTGSSSATPRPLTKPCEFNTCATGSPAEGFNASDTRLNYINSFPVDAVRFGIQTLSPKFFGGSPDFVVSGPNVGNNLGSTVMISGTVGAATEAAIEGIPSVAFSGDGGDLDLVSYTTLTTSPRSTSTIAANIYASLTTTFTNALLASSSRPILPSGITLNVNYPSISGCSSASDFSFILTRVSPSSRATDVQTCGTSHLPGEQDVIDMRGCFATVSVIDARTKSDVDATTQAAVLNRLGGLLECLPN
ncbi:sure-like protein [Dendrothele bispora CBS 962.96]|uniref:Sure-like protein n=1 Tax=Dendrothele bispora (strain CBS 962.96) TaxID=1314807 RepID=A0A4S8MKD8_DENBC|nr:sure-like protein [Dendrothele bispora CBS 962.96]